MDDINIDLDNLIDNFENNTKNKKKIENKENFIQETTPQIKTLDKLLKEFQIDEINEDSKQDKINHNSNYNSETKTIKKCTNVFAGGNKVDLGLSDMVLKRCCHNMKCLKCDIDVVILCNQKWSNNVDYLFFRNNSPNITKMKKESKFDRDYRCFACQCQWCSISHTDTINVSEKFRWVCKGH
ncbi:hypothetical protein A3Q56_02986 [Intoshia linei]|uniref:Cilia- and flagella-associated protein 418 n=1 Tax=Intoshia linei TaxID=1819745 RepID=A0A177B6D2_9BILA|nr:hypothetical protein A3Q56_02986 [Intoshia linei]